MMESSRRQVESSLSGRTVAAARILAAATGVALVVWAFIGDPRIAGGPGFGIMESIVLAVGVTNLLASILPGRALIAILICEASIALTLLLAEFVLRATVSHRYYSAYQLNERYLYELVPGASREYRHLPANGGHTHIYHVNSLGFRGQEFAVERSTGQRVVIYGDSFIHAEFSPLQNTLAKQLEAVHSGTMIDSLEVINAGVAGYGPDQVLRKVEHELPWLKPDVLVVAVFAGNDFGDLVRNKLYRVASDGELVENEFSFSDQILRHAKLDRSELLLKKIARGATERIRQGRSHAASTAFDPAEWIERAMRQHLDEFFEYVIEQDNVVRELRRDPYSADISLLRGSPSADYKISLMDGLLARINATAKLNGVPLLLVIIPHPMDVMGGNHEAGVVDFKQYPDYSPSRLTDIVQNIAERHGIQHINLYPYFAEFDDPSALFMKGGDDHWNDEGQRYAAEIIYARLLELERLQ